MRFKQAQSTRSSRAIVLAVGYFAMRRAVVKLCHGKAEIEEKKSFENLHVIYLWRGYLH